MSKQTSLFQLKLYRVEGHLSKYLVNACDIEDAISIVYMSELEETYGNVDYFGYHAKQVDTSKEGIVLDEID
ncbi:hypothetical protein H5S09_04095 [Limosilactobacillus sp. STM2_1]|uniref:Uncharacterized protein n=1 Tax=Limosilactobacillus rudii TaxID=2759755 RepID=A0A7W3YN06_9LACO|nr:hypothetical protein [Limosilactobacillus rudii]MBB1078944.1 hypothetical protein [Limosilactobacillus rudii]MBB1097125.1 hypothetical protein [Limosilactobacillus rudii]MCD7134118.1 hypothetical protein [Limosilactobacillus rudii]